MIIANLIQFDLLFFFLMKSEGHFAAAETETRLQLRLDAHDSVSLLEEKTPDEYFSSELLPQRESSD